MPKRPSTPGRTTGVPEAPLLERGGTPPPVAANSDNRQEKAGFEKTSLLPGYQRPAFTASVGVREAQRGAGPTPLATDRTSIVGRKPAFEMIRGQEAPQPAALFR